MLAPSVLSRSKPLPAPSWQRAWQKTPWIRHLFGQILKPLTASHGVALWIASLQAIPASPLVLQENSVEAKTHDTSGQMCFEWFERSTHHSASSKTLADIYDWDLNKSTMTFDQWVTALRQACSRRRKLVPPTSESDYSSWLTPRAQESGEKQETFLKRMGDRTDRCSSSLAAQVTLWPTARVSSANGPAQSEIAAGNPKSRLEVSVMCWPTPTAQDFKKRGPNSSQHGLAESTVNWATPNTMDHMPPRSSEAMEKMLGPEGQRAGRSRPSNLREQIVWPTPRAQKTSSENPESWKARQQAGQVSTPPLAMAAIMWPTVTTQDAKNNAGPSQFERNTKPLNVEATLHAQRPFGRQGRQETGTGSQKVLNPRFVEWLVGWPIGWTEFVPAETVSCRWLPLMRGALSYLMHAQQQMENTQNDQYA
jgi:hypothetical protein